MLRSSEPAAGRTTARPLAFCAIVGALALLVAVFAPLAVVDVYGSVSLFDIAEAQGIALLAAAAGALVAVFLGARLLLWLCTLGAWVALLHPLLEHWLASRDESALGQLRDAFTQAASDAFGDVLTEITTDVTQLAWGSAVLLAGMLLLTWGALRAR